MHPDGIQSQRNGLRSSAPPCVAEASGDAARQIGISERTERRDLTREQRAMALLYPKADRPEHGRKGKASKTDGFGATRLKQAHALLRHSPDLARAVRDGSWR